MGAFLPCAVPCCDLPRKRSWFPAACRAAPHSHRMAGAGRDLWRSSHPTHLLKQDEELIQLPITPVPAQIRLLQEGSHPWTKSTCQEGEQCSKPSCGRESDLLHLWQRGLNTCIPTGWGAGCMAWRGECLRHNQVECVCVCIARTLLLNSKV